MQAGARVPVTVRIVIEVDAFEQAPECGPIYACVESVEVKQRDGLLSRMQQALLVEGVSRAVAADKGLPEGGPAIRVWLKPTPTKEQT